MSIEFQFHPQQPQIASRKKKLSLTKRCPECGHEFTRSKKRWVTCSGRDVKANMCPRCDIPLFYRKVRGSTVAVLMEDKIATDRIIAITNQHLSEVSDFQFDLGESTARERKFAYDLIPWARRFLEGAEIDIGMTTEEFLTGWLTWVLEQDWWYDNFRSLLMLTGQKQRLAWDYWEHIARIRGVESPKAARTQARLKELITEFET